MAKPYASDFYQSTTNSHSCELIRLIGVNKSRRARPWIGNIWLFW